MAGLQARAAIVRHLLQRFQLTAGGEWPSGLAEHARASVLTSWPPWPCLAHASAPDCLLRFSPAVAHGRPAPASLGGHVCPRLEVLRLPLWSLPQAVLVCLLHCQPLSRAPAAAQAAAATEAVLASHAITSQHADSGRLQHPCHQEHRPSTSSAGGKQLICSLHPGPGWHGSGGLAGYQAPTRLACTHWACCAWAVVMTCAGVGL